MVLYYPLVSPFSDTSLFSPRDTEFSRFCRKVRFLGKIQKSGVRNSMTYRLPNSRKSNFATEPLGALYGDAMEVFAHAESRPMASLQSTTPTSTEPLPNGPMMGRSGRRSWPVCGISRTRSNSTSACCMATGPTPWPKKGRWHRVLGIQTPEGREGHSHHRQPWLCLLSCPRGASE